MEINKAIIYNLIFICVCVVWGYSYTLVKDCIEAAIPSFFLVSTRFFLGAILLVAVKISIKKFRIKPFCRGELSSGAIAGMLILTAFSFQTFAAKYTTPANNGLLTGLHVIFVPLIIFCITRKVSKVSVVAAALSVVGVALVSGVFELNTSFNSGDVLSILAALFFAFQFVYYEKVATKHNAVNFSIVQFITVAVVSMVLSLLFERNSLSGMSFSSVWIKLLVLGIISTGVAYLVQFLVQTKISASSASVILCLETVFAVVFSVYLGFSVFSISLIAGAALIIFSMVLNAIKGNKQKNG